MKNNISPPLLDGRSREVVYATSSKGRPSKQSTVFVSDSVKNLLAYRSVEFEKNAELWTSLVHPDDRSRLLAGWRDIVRSGEETVLQYRMKPRKSKEYVWVEDRAGVRLDGSGKCVGVIGSVLDISERKRIEFELRDSEVHLRGIFDDAAIGMYRTTPDGHVLMANKYLLNMLGYANFGELAARNLNEEGFTSSYPRRDFRRQIERDGSIRGFEAEWRKKNGSTVSVRENAHVVRNGKGRIEYYEGTVEDISDRKRSEKTTTRINQILKMASDVDQLIIRESEHDVLLDKVCRTIVSDGGYLMAWIGTLDERSRRITPIVWSGKEAGYLKNIVITADEGPRGNGPVGMAAKSLSPSVCNDVEGDPLFKPWRARALKRGFRAVATFPMRVRGTVIGLLSVYDGSKDRFGPEEIHLVSEVADNIGFALWAIEVRKQQEAADDVIKDREYWLNESQRVAGIGSYKYEVRSRTWSCSAVLDELLGIDSSYKRDFRSWLKLIHPDDRAPLLAQVQTYQRSKKQFSSEFRIIRANDQVVRWMWGTAEILHDSKGKPVRLFGTVQDISDRKLAEEALVQSENLFHTSFENSSIGIALLALDGKYRKVNARFSEMMGYSPDELAAYSCKDLTHPDDAALADGVLADAFTSSPKGGIVEKRYIRKDGRIIWVEFSVSLVRNQEGEPDYLIANFNDITERKQAEEAFRNEHILLRTLIDNLPSSIYVKDSDYRKTLANPANVRHTGMRDESEVLGKNDFDLYPRELAEKYFEDDQKVIRDGQTILVTEEYGIGPDGERNWQLTSKIPLRDKSGKIVGLIGIGTDITERKKAEENERRERILLKTLFDHLPASIWVKDKNYRRTAANKAHIQRTALFLGKPDLTEEDFIGKTDFDVYDKAEAEEYYLDDQTVVRDGKTILDREELVVDSKGERHWQLVSKVPLVDQNGEITGLIGIVADITRQKEAEEARERERVLLRAIIDRLPASIWVKDTTYRKFLVNKGHIDRMSLFSTRRHVKTEEDLLSTTDFDMYPEEVAVVYNREDRDVIENGMSVIDREEMLVDKNGTKHWQLVSKVPLLDERGKATGLIGIVWDITGQKEAEEARERERVLLRTLIDNLPNAIFVEDKELKKLMANPAHVRRVALSTGKEISSEAQLIGKTDAEFYPQSVVHNLAGEDMRILEDGVPVLNREQYSVDPDGKERWELISKLPLRDESGEIIGLVGITSEITEQKHVEETLRRERILMKTILDHIPNSIFVKDRQGRKILVNPAHVERVSKHIGTRSESDLLGKTDAEVYPRELAEAYLREDERVLGDGRPVLNRPLSTSDFDGQKYWELTSKIPMRDDKGNIIGLVGVSTDITALREAEERLAESESKFRLLTENAPDIVFRYGFVPVPHFEYVSPSATQVNGYTPEEHYADPELIVNIVHPDDRVPLKKFTQIVDSIGGPVTRRWIRKDGVQIWVEILSRPVYDAGKKIIAVEGIVRDITERKKSEEALRKSEETMARITSSISDVIYSVDGSTGEFEYLSPAFEKTLGYTHEDIQGMGGRWPFLKSVVEGDDHDKPDPVMNEMQREHVTDAPVHERWWKRKDGSRCFIEDYSVPIYEDGRLIRVDGVLRDITERKLAEDEVEREKILLRTLIDNFPYAIYVKDRNYRKVIANPVDVRHFAGLSSETEIIGKTDFDIYPGEIAARLHEDDRKVIEEGQPIMGREEHVVDARGNEHWLLTTKVPLRDKEENVIGLVGVGIDVTEKRAVDEALRRSEAELRALFESMNDVVMSVNSEGRYLKVAPTDPSLLYRPADELTGKTLFDILPQDRAGEFLKVIRDVLHDQKTHTVEYTLEIGGEEKWRAASVSPMTEDSVIWVARDVTERKAMEKEITDSEKKYRELVENAMVGVYKINLSGTVVYVNKAMADMLEFESPQEMMSVSFSSLYKNVEDMADLIDELRDFGKTGKNKEVELVTRSGKARNVLISASLDRDVISGMAKDITEIRTLEREFIQTQKLEGLGNIAAGIAHDFNNILGVILGYSDLLGQSDYEEKKFGRGMQSIAKSAERGKSLVRQLLTFARKTDVTFESVVLNNELAEIEKLIQETFPRTIEVHSHRERELPPVLADATQIHQVLLNLCVNARDAMPGGGTLSLSTRVVPGTDVLQAHPEADGERYIEVSVGDTGSGMDAATRQRIFEPFFTTKDVGKGTGLGLSVVYGIIESHRGFIDVESEPGRGTTFNIYLPVLEHPIDDVDLAKVSDDGSGENSATILVIEDEEMLRELLRSVLTSRGHKLLLAEDGEEGVKIYGANAGDIDIVISDLGLPKLDGEEVVRRIKEIDGHAKIAIASGYISPEIKAELEREGINYFVQKPYRTSEVIKVVGEMLLADKK